MNYPITQHQHLTSMNPQFVSQWEQIPAAMFQLVEPFPRRAKEGKQHCHTNVLLSAHIWPTNVWLCTHSLRLLCYCHCVSLSNFKSSQATAQVPSRKTNESRWDYTDPALVAITSPATGVVQLGKVMMKQAFTTHISLRPLISISGLHTQPICYSNHAYFAYFGLWNSHAKQRPTAVWKK